ncbi:acVLRF1 family peptidyl-tRNA hydrolase [Nocardioides salsibiostraticola]
MTLVGVPPERLTKWVSNFEGRHGATQIVVGDGGLVGEAEDGSRFAATLPFDLPYAGPADVAEFLDLAKPPQDWGVLLVRKGGFAIARMSGAAMGESKTGQRHVQGRTKAGGQSQQRFSRRRDNQARQAYEAAAGHAVRILGDRSELTVVVGGDRSAVDEVLGDARLAKLRVVEPWLDVPDPRRSVLESAVVEACSIRVDVTNA